MKFSFVLLGLTAIAFQCIALAEEPAAELRTPDLKQLDLLQEIFSNPNVADEKIAAAMKSFDKAPIDKSVRDLANILKLLVTEHQLSLQSLRIISVAMDKLSIRTNREALTSVVNTRVEPSAQPVSILSSRARRDVLPHPGHPDKRTGAYDDFSNYESFGDLSRPRQKRFSYHTIGALALLALATSPYLWGGPFAFGPWAYRYGYPGYYPGYVPVAAPPAAAAAAAAIAKK
ncbi:uncharacterized protein LOC111268978 isoform X2 [Varroa jacobsoni]|uniref:uncharacterized protein LOC111268978 isoform X2 n=1 Tax=Varroa jacobsoni TaxID=62625 RepID=UPI000BF38DAA|nr:uncharacterized protein LOC111268978 isoform X2 [Varroa jacobsoni]